MTKASLEPTIRLPLMATIVRIRSARMTATSLGRVSSLGSVPTCLNRRGGTNRSRKLSLSLSLNQNQSRTVNQLLIPSNLCLSQSQSHCLRLIGLGLSLCLRLGQWGGILFPAIRFRHKQSRPLAAVARNGHRKLCAINAANQGLQITSPRAVAEAVNRSFLGVRRDLPPMRAIKLRCSEAGGGVARC